MDGSGTASAFDSTAHLGALHLADNDLVLDYQPGPDGDAVLAHAAELLAAGFNTGVGGIVSSVAALDPTVLALGVADNASLPTPYGSALGGPPLAGEDVDDTAVLVKFTWFGDLNLDGLIDFGDLSVFN